MSIEIFQAIKHVMATMLSHVHGFLVAPEGLQDTQRGGRPSATRNADTMANVREIVTSDHQWHLTMMEDESNISKETTRQILHEDLGKRKKRKMCAKFVPQRLTDEQKQRRETHITLRLRTDLSRQS
jgi:hypothetical protein